MFRLKFHPVFVLMIVSLVLFLSACGGTNSATENNNPASAPDTEQVTGDAPQVIATISTGSVNLRAVPSTDGKAVEIWIDQVNDLAAIDMQLALNTSQVRVSDADSSKDGVQLAPGQAPAPDFIAENMVDQETGIVRYAVVRLPDSGSFSGSGLVATLNVEGELSSDVLSFSAVKLANSEGLEIK